MTIQYGIHLKFSDEARKNQVKAALTRIAAAANVQIIDRLGRTYPPTPRALVEWIADHAALVIALIHADRIDPARTRQVLEEIAAQEAATEEA